MMQNTFTNNVNYHTFDTETRSSQEMDYDFDRWYYQRKEVYLRGK